LNTLCIKAVDLAGNENTISVPVNLDTVSPVVTITAPAAGLLTRTAQMSVSGTASEEFTSVSVNTVSATVTGNAWSAVYSLAEGPNTLYVKATDRAGNSGSATVAVNLDATAPAAPLLTLQTTPRNAAATSITGSAEAGSTVKVSAAGALIGTVTADAQGNFTLAGVTLVEGTSSFTATATDAAGNESLPSAPLSIVLDTKAPVISVSSPTENAFFRAPQTSVKGSMDEAVASLTINGQPAALNNLDFDQPLTLTPGLNSITLVATDLAGNSATKTVLVTLDSTPPVVTITAPISGGITKNAQVTVTGTISKPNTTATITSTSLSTGNGTPVTVTGQAFSFTYTLSEGDNSLSIEATDRAGNKGSAAVTATLDTQPPLLSFQAPAEAAAGSNVALTVNASDNRQLTLVELKADGVPIWSGGNAPVITEAVPYRLSPTLNTGAELLFQVRGIDTAGNEATATATIRITQAAMGPGYIQGKVLDDNRGLLLAGAEVEITHQLTNSQNSLTTQTDGGYFLEAPAGSALVKVAKPGYTTVERLVPVISEKNNRVPDARLTKISDTKNVIDAVGGVVKSIPFILHNSSFTIELTVPTNSLSAQADIRLTPVSNQGLAGLLPLGWSPLAAVDIRLLDPTAGTALETTLASAATLQLPLPTSLTIDPAIPPMLARYDETTHKWLAVEAAEIDNGNAIAEITAAGQYALVVADPAPNAPPVAAAGNPIAAAPLQPLDFSLTTASGRVVPQASPPSTGLKAAGEVIVTAKEGTSPTFTSGLVLGSRITENFDLKSGDKVESPVYNQDIVLYRLPCITNIGAGELATVGGANLRTTFPVSPSKDYTIVDLLLGKVGIEINKPDTTETGVMVGTDGGRLVDADGNILLVPQGALSQTTPVSTRNAAAATGAVGNDFTFIRAVELNLTRQTLATSATISIPAPDGLDAALPLIVAKQIDVKGVAKLKLVALARQNGSFITSEFLSQPLNLSTTQLNASGVYYFLQAKAPFGFVTGTVTDAGNAPFTGALVKSDTGSLVDLSTAAGKYLLGAPVAPFTATALDLYKNDEGSATAAITAANQAVTLDLKVLLIPPTVVSVTPAGINIQPNVPVVVTFSKAMDQNSINSQTLKLTNSTGTDVPGVFTWSIDAKTMTFTPATLLTSEKSYTVAISGSIKDLQGYPLGSAVTSTFTVRKTTPPPMPAAGSITATFPDADGFVTVTATQGSAEAGNTVLLINETSGEIQSVTPLTNGSFTGRIRAQLGDEIKVVLMDYSGNQTLISYITYKSDDGKYLVTSKGGKVEGEGGSILEIPEGALVGPAVLKITPITEDALPHPVPEGSKFLAAVNIDSGGFNFRKEVHLSVPAPPDMPTDAVPFLARPSELINSDGTAEKVYEIIDSTKIVNSRITTASPPFDGVVTPGPFVFLYANDPLIGDVIVSGTAYRDMDGLPGYTEGVDQPIRGAVIRTPQAENFVSYSNSTGHYATFGFAAQGACRNFPVTAIHPQTMNRVSANVMTCDAPYIVNHFNFKLADKDTNIPDKTAPVMDINMKLAPDQDPIAKMATGVVTVGANVQVEVNVIDQDSVTAKDIDTNRTYAYVTAAEKGWRSVDVTDPTKPYTAYSKEQNQSAFWSCRGVSVEPLSGIMAMTENIRFADNTQFGYLRLYDIAKFAKAPILTGREILAEAYSGIPGKVVASGDYAYVLTIGEGIQIVDIQAAKAENAFQVPSDGSAIVGAFDSSDSGYGEPNDFALFNGTRGVLTTNHGYLLTMDFANPEFPEIMAEVEPAAIGAGTIAVASDYQYLDVNGTQEYMDLAITVQAQGNVKIVDLTNPYNPERIAVVKDEGAIEISTIARDIAISKRAGLAFITTYNSVQVIDIKDPYNPKLLNTITGFPDAIGKMIPIGLNPALVERDGVLYLASQANGIRVLDLIAKNDCDLTSGYSAYQNRYDDIIKCVAIAAGVNPLTIKEVIAKENSSFDNNIVVDQDSSTGLMQITPGTARSYGLTGTDSQIVEALKQPCINIDWTLDFRDL
jgi:hypothetical protein